jgi:hypothetical protein
MGRGISISAEDDDVAEALEAVVTGELTAVELAAELAEGVTLIVSFGDGSSYRYFHVPVDDAASLIDDPGGYNERLRGSSDSERVT